MTKPDVMPTKRTGFTNVRVCNDCRERIGEGDLCGCEASHPFVPGALVTLCSDEACLRPVKLAQVARLGNGAFRLAETADWYGLEGRPQGKASLFARARLPGDEQAIVDRKRGREMLDNVQASESDLRALRTHVDKIRTDQAAALRDAAEHEASVRRIDVAKLGDEARRKAEAEARARIESLLCLASTARGAAAKFGEDALALDQRIEAIRAWLEALPADVQTVRALGDPDALRDYLLAM